MTPTPAKPLSDATSVSAAAAGARDIGLPFPVSRHTDPVSVHPGARVIVRYRTSPDPASQQVTDVIGRLDSIDPLQVTPQARRGGGADAGADAAGAGVASIRIPSQQVVVLKTLSAAPVRNADIRAVEAATARAFPGEAHTMIGGWMARAGDGITERSNSAVPLGPTAGMQPVPLPELHGFYADHGLPTQLLIPDRIARSAEPLLRAPGVTCGPEIIVMTAPLAGLGSADPAAQDPSTQDPAAQHPSGPLRIRIDDSPTEDWFGLYHFRGQPLPREAIHHRPDDPDATVGYARVDIGDQLAAITRCIITDGWLGFSAVEVAERFRRTGLGTAMCQAVMAWGADHGATHSYLQVSASNTAGRALYHGLGFSEHHRHRAVTIPRDLH